MMPPPRPRPTQVVRAKLRRAATMPQGLVLAELAWRTARPGLAVAGDIQARRRPTDRHALRPFLLAGSAPGAAELPERAVRACIHEAEAALDGRFQILGHGLLDFGAPPEWSSDPVSGVTWPRLRKRQASRARHVGADVKVPWEASRMHWLVALARAYAGTGEARFRDGALRLLDEWTAANPTGVGVNWANTMEVGIRAVNLVWAAEIFDDPELRSRVGGLVGEHGWHIVGNPEYSPRLTSNHFLADVVGLVYSGAALRHTRAGRAWLRAGVAILDREVAKQFDADGVNFEASTGYHRLATELVLLGVLAAARAGHPVSVATSRTLGLALDALEAMTAPSGRLPAVGDDDSGLIVNLASDRDPLDPAPIVAAGRALLGAPRSPAPDGTAEEFARWAVGHTTPAAAPAAEPRRFPAAGRYVLRDERLWCLVECGAVGQRGNGGHAHNDTLSFVLAAGRRELVTDPGTFTYTRDPAARDRFRGTRAHATVQVDGEEINRFEPGALFRLRGDDQPVVEEVRLTPDRQRVSARHHGYQRLTDPVTHRRSWELAAGELVVADELACRGRHQAELAFPLAVGVEAEPAGGAWRLRTGPVVVELRQVDGAPIELTLVASAVSLRYGALVESHTLRATVPVWGTTTWAFQFAVVGA